MSILLYFCTKLMQIQMKHTSKVCKMAFKVTFIVITPHPLILAIFNQQDRVPCQILGLGHSSQRQQSLAAVTTARQPILVAIISP